MSKLRLYGDTSGYIDVAAPATADNSTLDLSTVAKTNSANTFTGSVTTNNNLVIDASTDGSSYRTLNFAVGSSAGRIVFTGDSFSNPNYGQGDITIQTQSAGGQIRFGTGAAQVNTMKIDESGCVTMPYQPAFMAVNAASGLKSGGDNVGFTATNTNAGNHFDTSTSRFNVPVSGTYHFDFGVYCTSGNNPSFSVQRNGSEYRGADVVPNAFDNARGYARILTCSFVASATSGDYITLNVRVGGYSADIYGGHSWFAGHLIG